MSIPVEDKKVTFSRHNKKNRQKQVGTTCTCPTRNNCCFATVGTSEYDPGVARPLPGMFHAPGWIGAPCHRLGMWDGRKWYSVERINDSLFSINILILRYIISSGWPGGQLTVLWASHLQDEEKNWQKCCLRLSLHRRTVLPECLACCSVTLIRVIFMGAQRSRTLCNRKQN